MLNRAKNYKVHTELKCPTCQGSYLHQGSVEIFNRAEDADQVRITTVTKIGTHEATISDSLSLNPSARRHGMRINFYCEFCDGNSQSEGRTLNIAQHKGLTFVYWEAPDAHNND